MLISSLCLLRVRAGKRAEKYCYCKKTFHKNSLIVEYTPAVTTGQEIYFQSGVSYRSAGIMSRRAVSPRGNPRFADRG
jgi:hypothetical protein